MCAYVSFHTALIAVTLLMLSVSDTEEITLTDQ